MRIDVHAHYYPRVFNELLENIDGVRRRGLSEDEAVQQPLDATTLDPYPIGQRLFERSDWVTERNIRNVYQHVIARKAQPV